MATLAIVTLPLSGHIHPMMAAARALRDAGHRPVILGPVDLVTRLPEDIESRAIGTADLPEGRLDEICACLSRMSSLSDIRQMFSAVARLSQFYIDNLPAAIERIGADAVLHDQLEPAAGIVARGMARTLGLKHVSLACALPMNREPSIPPPFMGWQYRRSAFGHWLNGGYYTVVNALLREQGRVLETAAKRFGLSKPRTRFDGRPLEKWEQAWSVDDGLSRQCDMAQGLATLDYPRIRPPLYLGPLRDDRLTYPGYDMIAHERNGRPLCFISLGTLMGGRAKLLNAMARAAIAKGLQPVVVHGGRLPDSDDHLPVSTIARDFLDQRDILSHCRAAIIHGGYNSTTDAVAAGVPIVTVPIAFEQSAIAARLERADLGRCVSVHGPSLSQRIRLALGDAMQSESMKAASRRAHFEALAAPGLPGLVMAIVRALGESHEDEALLPTVSSPRHAERFGETIPLPAE